MLEHEGTEADRAMLGESPDLSGDEPVIFDLYLRLRRGTPGDAPVSIDQALTLHRILIGEPFDASSFLDEIDALESEFVKVRSPGADRKRAQDEKSAATKKARS